MRRVATCLLGLVAVLCAGREVALGKEVFKVTYLSSEHVYVDGGKADGIVVGARLHAKAGDGSQTVLEVVFAAEHSSSCVIAGGRGRIAVGDRVAVVSSPAVRAPAPADTTRAPAFAETLEVWRPGPRPRSSREATLMSGSVSLLVYDWNDNSDADLDFTQTTARISLKARRLWGKELHFALRARAQYDQRARAYYGDAGENDWDNRVWEFSLGYGNPGAPVSLVAGRLLPRRMGGAGYIDGALAEWQFSTSLGAGLFGGRSPDWLYNNANLSLAKAGGYLSCSMGTPDRFRFEQTAGVVGEYHGGEVNREFIVLQGRFGNGRRWGVDHTSQVDVNRGWRKEKSGSSAELSNLYVNGWTRIGNRVRLGIRYDNRTNVWTYENRALVDSLFDERLRQGARVQLELSPGSRTSLTGAFGYHDRSGDADPTLSYSGSIRRSGLFLAGVSIGLQAAGFDGPFEKGYNYAVRLGRSFSPGALIEGAYGGYSYSASDGTAYRDNRWVELSGQADIGRSHWAGLRTQYDSGDDISGLRLMLELGYRF
jgi:hypothetical protein